MSITGWTAVFLIVLAPIWVPAYKFQEWQNRQREKAAHARYVESVRAYERAHKK